MEIVVGLEDKSIEETPKSMEEKDGKIWSEIKIKKMILARLEREKWFFLFYFMKNDVSRNEFGQVEKLI